MRCAICETSLASTPAVPGGDFADGGSAAYHQGDQDDAPAGADGDDDGGDGEGEGENEDEDEDEDNEAEEERINDEQLREAEPPMLRPVVRLAGKVATPEEMIRR